MKMMKVNLWSRRYCSKK